MNATCTCTFHSDGAYEFGDDECPDHGELVAVLQRINPCGCGSTQAREDMINLIRDVLAAHEKDYDESILTWGSPERLIKYSAWIDAKEAKLKELLHTDAIRYLILDMLSWGPVGHNWLEHGGSVDGSWLTPEGERALELLRQRPEGFR